MKIQLPDYHNSIVNLACSILNHFGSQPAHSPLVALEKYLEKRYKNIVILLLDGLGVHSLKEHLSENSFLNRHLVTSYSSTFPPTTVAATTALESGLYPSETGWLGWTGYVPEIDKNVVFFLGKDSDTGEQLGEKNYVKRFFPYENIREKIRKAGYGAYYVAPFVEPYPANFSYFLSEVGDLCDLHGEKFIYAYWDEPDHTMHDEGVHTQNIGEIIRDIDLKLEDFAESLEDTLLIVTADHGHIDVRQKSLTNYPDLCETLVRMPSIEPRALNFFVKEGKKEEFCTLFHQYFANEFLLLSKEEVILQKLFGEGSSDILPLVLGDYLAVAISDTAISNTPSDFLGAHAGLTKEEMTIPLIIVSKP